MCPCAPLLGLVHACSLCSSTGQPCSVFDLDAGHCTVLEPSCVERRLPELPTQLSRPLRARLSRLRAKAGARMDSERSVDWISPGFGCLKSHPVPDHPCHVYRIVYPRAPVPSPQVRWLEPPGTHPNHLRNGGGPGALGSVVDWISPGLGCPGF